MGRGTVIDGPNGINMARTGKLMRWVAIKGHGPDWAIYLHLAIHPEWWIIEQGDKVGMESNIRKLVDCTDEVYARYRL